MSKERDLAIESAKADARAARVAQGLPAEAEDVIPPTANRRYITLPSGDLWPESEPVPPEVAALELHISAWTPRKNATKGKTGR